VTELNRKNLNRKNLNRKNAEQVRRLKPLNELNG
jgi:hypothetical protein